MEVSKMQKKTQALDPYTDMIHLRYSKSPHRKHMSLRDRAAQFSPFAALSGYDLAIKEAGRLTDHRIVLDEEEKNVLDEKLRIIQEE
jgi:hypothetical protein